MVTVLRARGFRIVIFANDHEPAHVHAFGDGEAKINLLGAGGGVDLVWAIGLSRADIRRAMALVTQHRDMLLERWSEIRDRSDRR
ncbi:DUF4160 domain-containing protein [uncultured Caulobacter sp.]|uniref:DUF4160 domain-containing protein n=1 Tax=uncultured Caulobacter sp. TaxID=158749 RepID=UPI00260A42DA|nr:DUF4160 domain-containing protein [uncultured Caulobacter sp.]